MFYRYPVAPSRALPHEAEPVRGHHEVLFLSSYTLTARDKTVRQVLFRHRILLLPRSRS